MALFIFHTLILTHELLKTHCLHRSLDNEVVHALWRILYRRRSLILLDAFLLGLVALPRSVACVVLDIRHAVDARRVRACLYSFICAMLVYSVDDKTERAKLEFCFMIVKMLKLLY